MLTITAKTKANMAGVPRKVKSIANNKQLGLFLAEQAAAGMDKYVPMRTGQLAGSATPSPFKVTYSTPYAVYVFNGQGKRFSRDMHPNAQAQWHKAYAIAGGAQLGKAGTAFLKGL